MLQVDDKKEADFQRNNCFYRFENVTDFLCMRQHAQCDRETIDLIDRFNRKEKVLAWRQKRSPQYREYPSLAQQRIHLLHGRGWDVMELCLEARWGKTVWEKAYE